jgi:SAM-dependent methyltransferase
VEWDPEVYGGRFGIVAALGAPVVDWLDPQPGERICDLGCGDGVLTERLVEAGARVVAFDADPAMVAAARDRLGARAEIQRSDARHFTLDTPVDAVFSSAVLHWVPDASAAAERIVAALRPGGRFVAELGGAGNIAHVMSAIESALADRGHDVPPSPWYYPTIGAYATVLESAGLTVRRAELIDRPTPQQPGDDGLALWLRFFGRHWLTALPEGPDGREADLVLATASERARDALWDGEAGRWVIDHVRLRVAAVRP